jgi:hypothetical protein
MWIQYVTPSPENEARFSKCQESCSKNVDPGFGVVQAWFSIVQYPALHPLTTQMWEVINAYVFMHNIIIGSEQADPVNDDHPYNCRSLLAEVDH